MPVLAVITSPIDMTSAVIVTVPVPAFIVAPELFVNVPVVQVMVRFSPVATAIAPVTVHEPPYIVRLYGRLAIAPIVARPVPVVTMPIVTVPVEDRLPSIAVVR